MTDFDIQATHACGHTERHTGGSASGDMESLLTMFLKRKCSACRPTCEYCHRTGDRENMLVTDDGHVYCNAWCRVQALNPSHYCEHNDIAIPGFLKDWEDHSYHNDLCGRSAIAIGIHYLTIWVNFEKIEDREDPSCTRFVVEFCPEGDNRGDEGDMLYMGDDAAVAAQWARAAEIVESGADADADMVGMVAKIRELIAVEESK